MVGLKRVGAYLIDLGIIGGYIGVLAIVGLFILHHSGQPGPEINTNFKRAVAQLGAFLVLTLPATIWLALWEYAPRLRRGSGLCGSKS